MQCVILAAGRGTRMGSLTENTPKSLIEVCGKPILQHIVEVLPEEVDELILVVNHLEDQVRAYVGTDFLGRRVQYIKQESSVGGTGEALLATKAQIKDRFLFMYSDDIHGPEALKTAVTYPFAMLSARHDEPQNFGVLEINTDNTLKAIYEKPKNPTSNLINIGGMVLDKGIFEYEVERSEKGELYVTDMVSKFAKENTVVVVPQSLWLPINKPEDIATAEALLCSR